MHRFCDAERIEREDNSVHTAEISSFLCVRRTKKIENKCLEIFGVRYTILFFYAIIQSDLIGL